MTFRDAPISAKPLADTVIAVSGAGRGFGHSIARALGLAGATVVVVDPNPEVGCQHFSCCRPTPIIGFLGSERIRNIPNNLGRTATLEQKEGKSKNQAFERIIFLHFFNFFKVNLIDNLSFVVSKNSQTIGYALFSMPLAWWRGMRSSLRSKGVREENLSD